MLEHTTSSLPLSVPFLARASTVVGPIAVVHARCSWSVFLPIFSTFFFATYYLEPPFSVFLWLHRWGESSWLKWPWRRLTLYLSLLARDGQTDVEKRAPVGCTVGVRIPSGGCATVVRAPTVVHGRREEKIQSSGSFLWTFPLPRI
jgi:hypothetical protein